MRLLRNEENPCILLVYREGADPARLATPVNFWAADRTTTHPLDPTRREVTVLLKMDSILKAFDLERKDLDFKTPRKIRDRIAGEIIGDWYLIGRVLNVSQRKLDSIRVNNIFLPSPEDKAVAVLDAWDEEHGLAATCLKLAEALYNRRMMRIVEILCEEVKRLMKHDKTRPAAQLREMLKKEEAEATATNGESSSLGYSWSICFIYHIDITF